MRPARGAPEREPGEQRRIDRVIARHGDAEEDEGRLQHTRRQRRRQRQQRRPAQALGGVLDDALLAHRLRVINEDRADEGDRDAHRADQQILVRRFQGGA